MTTFGVVSERRPYFYCPHCKTHGFFESSKIQSLSGKISPRAAEVTCLHAQQSSFAVASDMLKRILLIQISESSVKNISEGIGHALYSKEGAESVNNSFLPREIDEKIMQNRSYLEIDGAMIHHLEDWKENKLGLMFSEADIVRSGKGENERISLKKKTLVSSFAEGVGEFKKRLRYWIAQSGTSLAKEIIIISDGAVWIENLVSELLPRCVHILDWFHVKEKLWGCARELFGESSDKIEPWVQHYADLIWDGKIREVLNQIMESAQKSTKQTPYLSLHQYFAPRVNRMQYDQYRQKGYYIGSGAVESANRYAVQDRLKKSGMMWSTNGANGIAKLKTMYLSDRWDNIWLAA